MAPVRIHAHFVAVPVQAVREGVVDVTATKRWTNIITDDGGTIHVIPIGDLITHVTDDDGDCACGPTTEAVKRDSGTTGWLIIHHSLDGREKDE